MLHAGGVPPSFTHRAVEHVMSWNGTFSVYVFTHSTPLSACSLSLRSVTLVVPAVFIVMFPPID